MIPDPLAALAGAAGSDGLAAPLTDAGVIPGAIRAGLLTEEELVWQDVLVEQIGRSHPVYRVAVSGEPRFVVKVFAPRRGDTDGDPAREHAVAELARARPEVAAVHAQALDWSDDPRVVATRFVAGTGSSGAGEPGADAREALDLLVGPLAAFHVATRDQVRASAIGATPDADGASAGSFEWDRTPPWALRLFDGDAPAEVWASPPLAEMLTAWASDREALGVLREARARWHPLCLVHGDLKYDNLIVARDRGRARVVLVDWEMARLGDPAWDLAGLSLALLENGAEADDDAPLADAALARAARLVERYSTASGLAPPPLARRLALYAGAWLLMSAVQLRSTMPATAVDTPADGLARRARRTLLDVERNTRGILSGIGAG